MQADMPIFAITRRTDPMSARNDHLCRMLPRLEEMRDAVARAARVDPDRLSHQAHLMQARTLRLIYGQITSTWANAAQEVAREAGEADEADVELLYAERLGHWLRAHVADTACQRESGEVRSRSGESSESDRDVVRVFAQRHYDMVAEYCETHADALERRAAELRWHPAPTP